jgi:ubiquinone biosynthesis protein COQ9
VAHADRMEDSAFDRALVVAAFAIAGRSSWRALTVADAAREAGLPLPRARARAPSRAALLLRFGLIADQAALEGVSRDQPVRDRLFDSLMRRFDLLQSHREGVLALMRALPQEPATALLLALATRRSMRWILEAAGVSTVGLKGDLRVRGLCAVWYSGVRAWQRDHTPDLAGTMAAVDQALRRAERAAQWIGDRESPRESPEEPFAPSPEPPLGPADLPPEPPPTVM